MSVAARRSQRLTLMFSVPLFRLVEDMLALLVKLVPAGEGGGGGRLGRLGRQGRPGQPVRLPACSTRLYTDRFVALIYSAVLT